MGRLWPSTFVLLLLQEGLSDSKPREFRNLLALDESMSELVNVLQPPGRFESTYRCLVWYGTLVVSEFCDVS